MQICMLIFAFVKLSIVAEIFSAHSISRIKLWYGKYDAENMAWKIFGKTFKVVRNSLLTEGN